jgi:Arc/MetJ family transcription regulator
MAWRQRKFFTFHRIERLLSFGWSQAKALRRESRHSGQEFRCPVSAKSRIFLACMIRAGHTHGRPNMRTNIVIDGKLITEAMRATGARTKREAVELGLRALVRLKKQEEVRGFWGKLKWRDDLERMRSD